VRIIYQLLAVLFYLLTLLGQNNAQSLQNGSFEEGPNLPARGFLGLNSGNQSISNWTIESGTIDYIGSFWVHSDGTKSIDLNGSSAGAISQDISTVVGETYTLEFDLSGNGTCPDEIIKSVSVTAGDYSNVFDFDVSRHSNNSMGWETQTVEFTALSPRTTIRFTSQEIGSFCGAAIDNVVVFDCSGAPNGTAVIDACGICLEPTDPDFNQSCADCAGTPNGTANRVSIALVSQMERQ